MTPRSVCIVQEYLPHYRNKFFDLLRENLKSKNIRLDLFHASKMAGHLLSEDLPWAIAKPIIKIKKLSWQAAWYPASVADLTIVQQESKYLLNYVLLLQSLVFSKKLAVWGHGRNFRAQNSDSISERVKQFFSSHVHWWFAYNDLSASIVHDLGYPTDRITNVQNSIDTKKIRRVFAGIDKGSLDLLRKSLGIRSKNICIFTGGMYAEKRLEFLFEASQKIRSQIPDFELILIGKGDDVALAEKAAAQHAWIHYMGAKNDEEKIPYWAISKLLLMPGLVGLVVLDSFALETPMVTTDCPYHSPEIDYLKSGENGVIVSNWEDSTAYANAVVNLLCNESERERLVKGCKKAGAIYTVEEMAHRFTDGVIKALNSPIYRK